MFPQHGTRGVNEVRMAWNMRGKELGGKEQVKRPAPPEGWSGEVVDVRPSKANFFGNVKPKASKATAAAAAAAAAGSSKATPVDVGK